MGKKRMIKSKKVRTLLLKGGRETARKDFFQLLKRIARPVKLPR